jgi:hypothetical protein
VGFGGLARHITARRNKAMITQLQTDYLPRPNGRSLKRRTTLFKTQVRKTYRANSRKITRSAIRWQAHQYFLTRAFADVRKAVRANEDIFIGIIIISITLGYAYAAATSELLYVFFDTAYSVAEVFDISMLALSVITLAVLGTSLAWVAAFSLTSLSTAMMHGLNGKKNRSLRSTMRHGLRYTTRTTFAWFLVASIIATPILLAGALWMSLLKFGSADIMTALTVTPYLAIAAITWIVYCLMQYSLVPYIAIFEPQLSFSQVFMRSHALVQRKGRIFLLTLHMTLLATIAGIIGLSYILESQFRIDQSLTINFGSTLAFIAMNAMMVVFYRKRRLARK